MERLRKKDAEAGVQETTLTDAQREAIAEARRVYEARVAERRICTSQPLLQPSIPRSGRNARKSSGATSTASRPTAM